jgi:hypothetical protein
MVHNGRDFGNMAAQGEQRGEMPATTLGGRKAARQCR